MARISPFAALRPLPEYAAAMAALPYDVMSTSEARAMASGNPLSFLHVDKAEINFPPGTAYNDAAVYAQARATLQGWQAEGILARDNAPCFYIYRLTVNGCAQTGLAACVEVEDYNNGRIKKHELTRADKEQDRIHHIKACKAHTGPIFLTYRTDAAICGLLYDWTRKHDSVYDFVSAGVRQEMWVMDDAAAIKKIIQAFDAVPYLYIADGHHRSAAAAKAGGSAQFLGVIFPHDELHILDYNRLIEDLNGLTNNAFLKALEKDFTVTPSAEAVKPAEPYTYGLYLDGSWYRLTFTSPPPEDAVDRLTVSVLQDYLLAPILGIKDPRKDKRIDFVGGIRGTDGLIRRVDEDEMACAFTVCPTTLEELLEVADADKIMPPKSTWFEPKLLSGLLIHTLDGFEG